MSALYHFGRPRLPLSTAASDARRFAAQIGNVKQAGYLPPVLDLEVTGGLSAANITAWARSFLVDVCRRRPVGCRWSTRAAGSGGATWATRGDSRATRSGPPSTRPSRSDRTSSVAGRTRRFWQYTDAGLVSGIRGRVDASWFHGTQAQLNSLAYAGLRLRTSASPFALLQTRSPGASPGADVSSSGVTGSPLDGAVPGHGAAPG